MQHPGFFHRAGPFPLRDIATMVGAALTNDDDGSRTSAAEQSQERLGSERR
jgi:hypothetical protein